MAKLIPANSNVVDQNEAPVVKSEYDVVIKLGHPVALHQRTEHLRPWTFQAKEPHEQVPEWKAPVIAILGSFDAGKTWLINQLLSGATCLATGLDVHTEGLSYKKISHQGQDLIFLDSAGSDHLIKMESSSTDQVQNKELEDLLTRQFLFELADVFIFVVNEITLTEQIMIAKFVNKVRNSNKAFKEVYIIHNFKSSTTQQLIDKQWQEVKDHYPFLQEQKTLTTAVDGNGKPDQKAVPWLGGVDNQRHVYLASHNSPAGVAHNAFCIQFLLFSLVQSVVVTKPFKVLNKFKEACQKILSLCLRITGNDVVNWDIALDPVQGEDAAELDEYGQPVQAAVDGGYHTYELKLASEKPFEVTLQEYFQQRLDLMNSIGNLLQDPDFPFQMNIYEKKRGDQLIYVMKIAVPYHVKSNVRRMKNNCLRIAIKTADLDKQANEISREYSMGIKAGRFSKVFQIPSDYDALRHEEATYENGIFTVVVPPIPDIPSDPDSESDDF